MVALTIRANLATGIFADTTPDSGSFASQSGVAVSTLVTSAAITPTGYDSPTSIDVSGEGSPEYCINPNFDEFDVWGDGAALISPGNTVAVRGLSSASNSTAHTIVLTIGTVNFPFVNTTVAAGGGDFVEPRVYDLALIFPREAGTAPSQIVGAPNFPSTHYILFACQSDMYEFQACAKDGALPYQWELVDDDGAVGLTVDADTGQVTWSVPSGLSNGLTFTPRIRVTDAEGTEREEDWTITIDSTKFRFFSGTGNDLTGDGSRTLPWRSMSKLRSSMTPGQIAKFSNGTYDFAGMYTNSLMLGEVDTSLIAATALAYDVIAASTVNGLTIAYNTGPNAGHGHLVEGVTSMGGNRWRITAVHQALPAAPSDGDIVGIGNTWQRVEWRSDFHCVQWMAVYGQTPVMDFNFTNCLDNWGAVQRIQTNAGAPSPVVVRGFTLQNYLDKCFQTIPQNNYCQFENLYADENGPQMIVDGSNPGVVMNVAAGGVMLWLGTFRNIVCENNGGHALKLYTQEHPVIEACDTLDCSAGTWDVKAEIRRFDIRYTVFNGGGSNLQGGFFGNVAGTCNGTYRFCLVDRRDADPAPVGGTPPLAVDMGQGGPITQLGPMYFIRCTLLGRVQVRNMLAAYGNMFFTRCAIENEDDEDGIYESNNAANKVTVEDNLVVNAADDAFDASGNLQGTYLTNYGPTTAQPRGYRTFP